MKLEGFLVEKDGGGDVFGGQCCVGRECWWSRFLCFWGRYLSLSLLVELGVRTNQTTSYLLTHQTHQVDTGNAWIQPPLPLSQALFSSQLPNSSFTSLLTAFLLLLEC